MKANKHLRRKVTKTKIDQCAAGLAKIQVSVVVVGVVVVVVIIVVIIIIIIDDYISILTICTSVIWNVPECLNISILVVFRVVFLYHIKDMYVWPCIYTVNKYMYLL